MSAPRQAATVDTAPVRIPALRRVRPRVGVIVGAVLLVLNIVLLAVGVSLL